MHLGTFSRAVIIFINDDHLMQRKTVSTVDEAADALLHYFPLSSWDSTPFMKAVNAVYTASAEQGSIELARLEFIEAARNNRVFLEEDDTAFF